MPVITLKFITKVPDKRQTVDVVEIACSGSVTIGTLRKVWEFEQTINNLPGTYTRCHLEINESESVADALKAERS